MQPLNRTLSSIVHGYSKKPEAQCICLKKKTILHTPKNSIR
jgi:hypothetical protein